MSHASAVNTRLALILLSGATVLAIVREGGAWILVVIVLLLARFARRRWPGTGDSHGCAALATADEVRTAEMTAVNSGLHLGELVDVAPPPPLLPSVAGMFTAPLSQSVAAVERLQRALGASPACPRLWSSQFSTASIIAASRSGKGAGLLIPTLMTYPGPILCLDPKAEIYRHTLAARRAFGRRVFCIDPYRIVHPHGADRYNPMGGVAADNPFVPDIAKDFAAALVVRTGEEKERFFPDASEHLIQAITAAVLWGGEPGDRNLATVADLIATPKLLANTLSAMQASDAYGGVLRTLGHQAAQSV